MPKYRIRDLQFKDRYFAEGEIFNSKKDVCEQLISYHEVENDMSMEETLLRKGKIDECWDLLSDFEWGLELVDEGTYKFCEELDIAIGFESSKDLSGGWTKEYREGFVDGLKRAKEIFLELK